MMMMKFAHPTQSEYVMKQTSFTDSLTLSTGRLALQHEEMSLGEVIEVR